VNDVERNSIRASVALKAAVEYLPSTEPWNVVTELASYFFEWLESKEGSVPVSPQVHSPAPPQNFDAPVEVLCPQCGSPMWDNRPKKASGEYKPNAADFTCKENRHHKIWPPKVVPGSATVSGRSPRG